MNDSLKTGGSSKKRSFLTNPKVVPYVFVAPFIIFFLIIYLYPFISTILMSFQRIDGPGNATFIGTDNYRKLFNRNFTQALATTFRYAFWDVVVLTIIPLIFAVILNSGSVKFPAFFKSLYFIPALTSTIVVGIVFRLAFGSLPTAPANRVLALFGQQPKDWLMFADTGNFVLILLTLWRCDLRDHHHGTGRLLHVHRIRSPVGTEQSGRRGPDDRRIYVFDGLLQEQHGHGFRCRPGPAGSCPGSQHAPAACHGLFQEGGLR